MPRVVSVGRLDLNSEGLLLLTNDGELARALELPSSGWVRHYRARAYGAATQAKLDSLKRGVTVEGVVYGPIDATLDKAKPVLEGEKGKANVWISVSLAEGKNREVRKVLEHIGSYHDVVLDCMKASVDDGTRNDPLHPTANASTPILSGNGLPSPQSNPTCASTRSHSCASKTKRLSINSSLSPAK